MEAPDQIYTVTDKATRLHVLSVSINRRHFVRCSYFSYVLARVDKQSALFDDDDFCVLHRKHFVRRSNVIFRPHICDQELGLEVRRGLLDLLPLWEGLWIDRIVEKSDLMRTRYYLSRQFKLLGW